MATNALSADDVAAGDRARAGGAEEPGVIAGSADPSDANHDAEETRLQYLEQYTFTPATGDGDEGPHVDVVHVMAYDQVEDYQEALSLSALVPDNLTSSKTEQKFRFDVVRLLLGDLTHDSVRELATVLLENLLHYLRHDGPRRKRALVLVAYGLGSLVVKMAVLLAAVSEETYPGIFTGISRIVFSRCLQRGPSLEDLTANVAASLAKEFPSHRTAPDTAAFLAECVVDTADLFVLSKISLRCRIVSIYPENPYSGDKNDPVYDSFNATLGVPNEIPLEDTILGTDKKLKAHMTYKSEGWVPLPQWVPLERALLSLAAPPRQIRGKPKGEFPSLKAHATFQAWCNACGPAVLYLRGKGESGDNDPHDLADQVYREWQARPRRGAGYGFQANVFSFTFDSTDPLRSSIQGMLAALVVEMVQHHRGSDTVELELVQDRLLLQCGWSDKSCLTLLEAIRPSIVHKTPLFVLHDFDQCDARSRHAFLDYLDRLEARSEVPLKILITSSRVLEQDMSRWFVLDVDDLELESANHNKNKETSTPADPTTVAGSSAEPKQGDVSGDSGWLRDISERVTCRCPLAAQRKQIKAALERLKDMDHRVLRFALERLQLCTGWPEHLSRDSLTAFIQGCDRLSPQDDLSAALNKVFGCLGHSEELRWVISWLLFASRPLSPGELAVALALRNGLPTAADGGTQGIFTTRPASEGDLSQTRRRLVTLLRGLADVQGGQVTMRPEVRHFMEKEDGSGQYIWDRSKETGQQDIAALCIAVVSTPEAQTRLDGVFQAHKTRDAIYKQTDQVTASLAPDGEDLLFYAVQALPHHLSRCPESYRAEQVASILAKRASESPFLSWARVYWAMSNPFSCTREPPDSPLVVLAGSGLLDWVSLRQALDREGDPETTKHMLFQCLAAAAEGGVSDLVSGILEEMDQLDSLETSETITDALVAALSGAVRANQEQMALDITKRIFAISPGIGPSLPGSLLWAAAWLDMSRLADSLLEHGASAEPEQHYSPSPPYGPLYWPSPLSLACDVGHIATVRVLLARGARTDVRRSSGVGPFVMAANGGHNGVLEAFLEHDPDALKSSGPVPALYRAAYSGCYRTATFLVSHGAPTDGPESLKDDSTPLTTACQKGHIRTTRALLEAGADPNNPGLSDVGTPLCEAAVGTQSLGCMRALLDHGADPNHERQEPPLACKLANMKLRSWENPGDADVDAVLALFDVLVANDPPMRLTDPWRTRWTPVMIATANKTHVPIVRWLMGQEVVAAHEQSRAGAALHMAAQFNNIECMRELLKLSPDLDVNSVEDRGEPLIHVENVYHSHDMLELLHEHGADLDKPDEHGERLINKVVREGFRHQGAVLSLLTKKGVDVNHRDRWGCLPICRALQDNSPWAYDVAKLAEAGADLRVTYDGTLGLMHRAIDRGIPTVKALLKVPDRIDLEHRETERQRTPLVYAASDPSTDLECFQLLLNAGADPNAMSVTGRGVLHYLPWGGPAGLLELMLAHRDVQPDLCWPLGEVGTPLQAACHANNIDVALALLDQPGVDVNRLARKSLINTPLVAALVPPWVKGVEGKDVHTRSERLVRELVRRGADVNLKSHSSCMTPLAAACLGSSVATINFLIESGAEPAKPDPVWGRLPLHFAAASGVANLRAVLDTPNHGDLMVPDKGGKTALHWAAQNGVANCVQFILSRVAGSPSSEGKDDINRSPIVDIADSDGWTPLCWALRPHHHQLGSNFSYGVQSEPWDRAATVRTLLRHGANRFITCRLGRGGPTDGDEVSLVELAQRCGAADEVLDLLRYGLDGETEEAKEPGSSTAGPIPLSDVDGGGDERPSKPRLKRYTLGNAGSCDSCFGPVFGIRYRCSSCPNFDVCPKCISSIPIFHNASTTTDPGSSPRGKAESEDGEDRDGHEFYVVPEFAEFVDDLAPPAGDDDADSAVTADTGGDENEEEDSGDDELSGERE